ncbi:MAG: nucleotide exchange factor GrpE [Candidatus Tagabacteria bacterium CG_4_9_14_0_2_um_filter_41_11]|uniref:Protein GrpE n=1 Tax=Candidatus Tagabacteria bacterium CG_4_9_14_0_2_um_filter_41_11 TaxID=1975019 RepID=A0A2M8ER37_9BACT|nr:MAG: nucleotide exchange factor GrpE [Candidatus Tagabacteria bacterium CG_4_9_14_0_2_um_filter_41_11]
MNEENNKEEITVEETVDDGGNLDIQEKFKQLQEKLKKCQELKEEYLNGWQRAKADLINARKDDERRNQDFAKFANFMLISDILPILDSFNLALENEKDSKFSKGVLLIKIQLEDTLGKYGFSSIKSMGEKMNLQLHEIVGEIESEKEEGIIIEEVQKGYLLHGRVIRPARVKISKQK